MARQLGVTPMTLYTYVPGKAELLDLMLDAAYLRMPRTAHAGAPWRARLETVARENRELYRRHPWVAARPVTHPPPGPGVMAKYEHELAAFDGLGLDDVTTDAALAFLLGFVESVARAELQARAAERDGAPTGEQWWAAHAPVLATVFAPGRYPRAARIGGSAAADRRSAHDTERAFTFGLGRALDGLAVLVERARSAP
ncbi:TetR/AcrR family transcriptional regulator C-terminal domain-containing protein [Streptomyces sp. CB02923]|uniref:TetR/AcrR family transcriptional regulator C-terminal domain-containing protein n=1 Tax=Streptomyces sp. CB02923 TaxID=1718985 RepID=UPI003082A126